MHNNMNSLEANKLLYDLKIGNIFRRAGLNIELLMSFYADKAKGDVESSIFALSYYSKLGWKAQGFSCYDIINSFWTIFTLSMHICSPDRYPTAPAGNVKIYKRSNIKGCLSFPEKYLANIDNAREDVKKCLERFPMLEELAALTHSVANITPIPDIEFNYAKGTCAEIQDYLPMMVAKIQDSIDKNEPLIYKKDCMVEINYLKLWKQFLIDTREILKLQDYYEVHDNRLVPVPLFRGQSLTNPNPTNEAEVEECLRNMVTIIRKRAEKLSKI